MIKIFKIVNLCLLALLLSSAIVNSQWASFMAVAQSVLTSLKVSALNGNVVSDPNFHLAVQFICSFDGNDTINSGFTTDACIQNSMTSVNGQNVYIGGTNGKRTYLNHILSATHYAAGQRLLWSEALDCNGMGDCGLGSQNLTYATADNVGGDEGIGYQLASTLQQQGTLSLASVTSVPTQTTCNTTITQNVIGGPSSQTISVGSTSNCNANDWVVIGQTAPGPITSKEALKITAVGGGAITGVFRNNHNSGVTVTPAKVLIMNSQNFGHQRVLVNLSSAPYSTGTVSVIAGGGFTGSGTAWANNVVGGTATNIGCIQLDADTYTGPPFDGSAAHGPLKMWYQINSVVSATSLGIFTYSTAGDGGYHGKGPGTGTYAIKPCAEILYTVGSTIILETTNTTWSASDNVEIVIPPYPSVLGFNYQLANYTTGGAGLIGFMAVTNIGARAAGYGFNVTSTTRLSPSGSMGGADTFGWLAAYMATGDVDVGLSLSGANSHTAALTLNNSFASGTCTNDNCGKIDWHGGYLMPNSGNRGFDFQMILAGSGGKLSSISDGIIGTGSNSLLNFTGMIGTVPKTFSTLPTCNVTVAGAMIGVTDSNTAAFGATMAGGGANKGIAYCDGTNWTFR